MSIFQLLKKRRVDRIHTSFKEDIEPHEILLDSLSKKRQQESGYTEKKLEVPLLRRILQGFFFFCFLILLMLFLKTLQLQVLEGEEYLTLAQENKFIISKLQAERGVIYDQNMNQLVFNLPAFDLVCNKKELPESELETQRVLRDVSNIIKKEFSELKEQIESSKLSQVLVLENLSHEELILLETRIKELPGFEIKNNNIRDYQPGPTFAHLIGYTGKINIEEMKEDSGYYTITDYVGRAGVENFYEEALRKNPGKLRIERDALGNVISKEVIEFPESGNSLVLWLDSELQIKLEQELEKALLASGAKKAAAVALDPRTGGILAMVSLPSFDNNLFQKGADSEALIKLLEDSNNVQPLFNRVVSGRYLTGSIIKPFIASAALEEEIISSEKVVHCEGLITVPHSYDPEIEYEFRDWRIHNSTDIRKAIAESCNVFFYTIGGGFGDQEGLGPTRIKKYLELFGWGDKTGIDFPGEATGFIPDVEWKKESLGEGWWDGDTYHLSIGQGYLLITPLEVVSAFAAIANRGTLYQPQVAKQIVKGSVDSLNMVQEFGSEIIRQNFIDPENLQVVREGMRQAVTGFNSPHASAVLLNSLPVKAAAKTGTAETGKENHYHAWVTAFAPYDDPEIVLTVMVEDVEGLKVVTLPVVKAVFDWYFSR